MPAGDKTGPVGNGPKTGRAMGLCNGFETPGYMNQSNGEFGRGRGFAGQGFGGNRPRARGRFWGQGRFFGQADTNAAEQNSRNLQSLKQQAQQLQNNLSQINKTIAELKEKE